MDSLYKYRVKCVNLPNHTYYLPIFENDSEVGLLTELFVERQSFRKQISNAIYEKTDFYGNAIGFHYDTDDSFIICEAIESGNSNERISIKREDLKELIKEFDSIVSKIDVFGRLIMDLRPCIYDKFKCLDSTKDYFNKGGLCGIVNYDDKWVFIGQEYPAPEDNPNSWLNISEYESLDELIGDTVITLARKMFIARKEALK